MVPNCGAGGSGTSVGHHLARPDRHQPARNHPSGGGRGPLQDIMNIIAMTIYESRMRRAPVLSRALLSSVSAATRGARACAIGGGGHRGHPSHRAGAAVAALAALSVAPRVHAERPVSIGQHGQGGADWGRVRGIGAAAHLRRLVESSPTSAQWAEAGGRQPPYAKTALGSDARHQETRGRANGSGR